MAKDKKTHRNRLNLDDVLAGRSPCPDARKLITLIREINPSGVPMPGAEMARRYALKNRLQSLFIRRFSDEIEINVDATDPGVVSLRHRPLDADACHAVIQELDDDARSWVQRQVDLQAHEHRTGQAVTDGSMKPTFKKSSKAKPIRQECADLSVPELLGAGQDALEAYDYDLARDFLERAFDQSAGSVEGALALLSLLVDHLAADEEALSLEGRLSAQSHAHPDVRLLLALAAARKSDRDRAMALLKDHEGPRGADVYVILARRALDSDCSEDAARDLAQARRLDPTHVELLALEDAVVASRARERFPLEQQLGHLVAEKRLDEAEVQARLLLARWPDSGVADRVLRTIDDMRKADESTRLLASADEAAAQGQLRIALSLMQQALATNPRGQDSTLLLRRIAEVEAAERAQAERAQIAQVVKMLRDTDRLPGLAGYVALNAEQRASVCEQVALPHLGWVDELGVMETGKRARDVAAAVIALERAETIVAQDPQGALDLLATHTKLLQRVKRSATVAREASRHLANRRSDAAAQRLDAALVAFHGDALDQAHEMLMTLPLGDLSEERKLVAEDLRAHIEHKFQGRIVERLHREGALVRSLQAVDTLLSRVQRPDHDHWIRFRQQLAADIRSAFRVHVDSTPVPFASLCGLDLHLFPGLPSTLHPRTGDLIFAESRNVWLFVYVVDVDSHIIRQRVALRTPTAIELHKMEIDGDRLVLIGRFASVLELSSYDWTILSWHDRLGFETDAAPPDVSVESSPSELPSGIELDFFTELVHGSALVPGTRFVWFAGIMGTDCFMRVADLARGRIVRSTREPWVETTLSAIQAVGRPMMLVLRKDEGVVTLHEPNGTIIERSSEISTSISGTVVVCPGQNNILLFHENDATDNEPLHWYIMTPGGGVEVGGLLDGQLVSGKIIANVDSALGMVYVKAQTLGGSHQLLALRTTGGSPESLERVFQVPIPAISTMVRDGHKVIALTSHDDGIKMTRLGAEPPQFRPGLMVGRFATSSVHFLRSGCHRPRGARKAQALAMYGILQHESRSAWLRRIDEAKHINDPDRIVELLDVLELCNVDGSHFCSWAWKEHPEHTALCILQAQIFARTEQWPRVRDLLIGVDPSSLDDGSGCHLHHLLGAALLHLGEPAQALQVLKRGAAYPDGCNLSTLIALCTPIPTSLEDPDDAEAWDDDRLLIRSLIRRIHAADIYLAQGDAESAKRVLHYQRQILEADEIQGLGRLAEAYLMSHDDTPGEPWWDMAVALASFCAAHAHRKLLVRRNLPLPHGCWSTKQLDALALRASQWLNQTLGEAFDWPKAAF